MRTQAKVEAATATGAAVWLVRSVIVGGFPEWGAGLVACVPPGRHGRGDIGAGGGRGVIVKGQGGRIKRASTRGGRAVKVRATFTPTGGAFVSEVGGAFDGLSVSVQLRAARSWAAGPLLQAVQASTLLTMARGMADGLRGKMVNGGKETSFATADDGTGAGVGAGASFLSSCGPRLADDTLTGAVWGAVVSSMSEDGLGESVNTSLEFFTPELLAASAMPLPGLLGDESRDDKASRLAFERARAARFTTSAARCDSLRLGANAKRAAVVDRIQCAAVQLLHGADVQAAAAAAGFSGGKGGRGMVSPGDRLSQAVRRVVGKFTLHARMGQGRAPGVSHSFGAGLPLAISSDWAASPSDGLRVTLRDGRKLYLPQVARVNRRGQRQAEQARRASGRAVRADKRQAKRAARAAVLRRALKSEGVWAAEWRGAVGYHAARAARVRVPRLVA